MPAVILRLLTLLALVLMPFGMGVASAAPVHHTPAAATEGHCDEHGGTPAKTSPDEAIDCAMACSMLLIAAADINEPMPTVRQGAGHLLAERSTGLHPDTATPPPKLS